MRRRQFNQLSLSFAGLGLAACSDAAVLNYRAPEKNSKFRVWWIQSFYPAETEALSQIVADWEKKMGCLIWGDFNRIQSSTKLFQQVFKIQN